MKTYEIELQQQLVQRINELVNKKQFPKETRKQFADYYDIPYRTLQRCCTGHCYPSLYFIAMLEKIRYIELFPEEILTMEEQKQVKEHPYVKKQIPDSPKEQAEYVKHLRKSLCRTQKEFCQVFHIPVRTLQFWESGKAKPAAYILRLLDMTLYYKDIYLRLDDTFESTIFKNDSKNNTASH